MAPLVYLSISFAKLIGVERAQISLFCPQLIARSHVSTLCLFPLSTSFHSLPLSTLCLFPLLLRPLSTTLPWPLSTASLGLKQYLPYLTSNSIGLFLWSSRGLLLLWPMKSLDFVRPQEEWKEATRGVERGYTSPCFLRLTTGKKPWLQFWHQMRPNEPDTVWHQMRPILFDVKWRQMRPILFDVKWSQMSQILFEAKWGQMGQILFDIKWGPMRQILLDVKRGPMSQILFEAKWGQMGQILFDIKWGPMRQILLDVKRGPMSQILFEAKWGQMGQILFDIKWGPMRQLPFEAKWGQVRQILFDVKRGKMRQILFDVKWERGRYCLRPNEDTWEEWKEAERGVERGHERSGKRLWGVERGLERSGKGPREESKEVNLVSLCLFALSASFHSSDWQILFDIKRGQMRQILVEARWG